MRPGQHNKRGRGRNRRHGGGSGGSGGGGGGNPLHRVYESNGPDVKVRGTAQTVAEKYLQLGRDAQAAGDTVMSESYFQHAEHYLRILAAAQAYNQQLQQQYRRPNEDGDYDEDGEESAETEGDDPSAGQQADQPVYQAEQPDMSDASESGFEPERSSPNFGNQGQGGQPRARERFRPRWERNRDRPGQQGLEPRDAREAEAAAPAPRPRDDAPPAREARDESPRSRESADANGAGGAWEAPSFLRRPSAAANGAGNAAPAEPRRSRFRPRRERAETPEAASDAPADVPTSD